MHLKKKTEQSLGLLSLTGLVIGSMIGSGIFNMMKETAEGTALMSIAVGWLVVGIGMLALVFCFLNLNRKRPDLDAGIYSYAQAGFGKYMGFNSAWGYWISALVGNIAYATILFSAVGYFFSLFGSGQNLASVIGSSVMLWLVVWLVVRGVKTASFINAIVTAAKLIPIGIFLVAIIAAFKFNIFSSDIWGNGQGFVWDDFLGQVRNMMLVTVFAFIGIEGAVVFSGLAKRRKDVGRATVLGFLTVLAIYVLMTVLSLGVKTAPELAALGEPAMASLLEAVVGKWGGILVNIGVIVAVAGAWLAWTMFAAELPFVAARHGTFPKIFGRENKFQAPVSDLVVTGCLVQVFLLCFLLPFGSSAYRVAISLCSSMILIPYALTAFYQLKLSIQEKAAPGRAWNIFVGVVASLYTVWLVYAGGLEYLLISMLLYAPGIIAYIVTQRESRAKRLFTRPEWVVALVILGLFGLAIFQIATGKLDVANL
jgi:arginine:ornithine antiporter/lysine permease